ncbi:MAG: RNA polymerase sporulation sigma factor SigH [Lachnospiraceae bacterium]|jgi:RNA polymerase sigma factor, sigma-70 family|nr:RNA polymerase sporulation sigma factor SigH [Lachnospiraceae bacterium]
MEFGFNKLPEDDIINMAQSGNDEAMTFLMEKYKSLVRQKTRTFFLTGGDKDDLIQEGMIGLYKAICDYIPEREASFKTFAELCISRHVYSAIKISNRMKNQPLNTYISIYAPAFSVNNEPDESDFMIDQELEIAEGNPEDIIINRESAVFVHKQLFKGLSKMETQVLSRYLDGMTYQEIAADMDKTPKSIDNALQRIKNKLNRQRNLESF